MFVNCKCAYWSHTAQWNLLLGYYHLILVFSFPNISFASSRPINVACMTTILYTWSNLQPYKRGARRSSSRCQGRRWGAWRPSPRLRGPDRGRQRAQDRERGLRSHVRNRDERSEGEPLALAREPEERDLVLTHVRMDVERRASVGRPRRAPDGPLRYEQLVTNAPHVHDERAVGTFQRDARKPPNHGPDVSMGPRPFLRTYESHERLPWALV